jgi:hypothetical protein
MQLVSRQWIGKHPPAAMNTQATIALLLETVFYTRSVQRGYKKDNCGELQLSDSNKNLIVSHRWVLDTTTDWPTDRRS